VAGLIVSRLNGEARGVKVVDGFRGCAVRGRALRRFAVAADLSSRGPGLVTSVRLWPHGFGSRPGSPLP